MNSTLIALILQLVEEAIKDTPQIVADLQNLFATANPTPADWLALREKVLAKSYADYVPASALPAASAAGWATGVSTPAVESNAPISQPGASGDVTTTIEPPKSPETAAADPAPAAAADQPAPYLPDGSPNPEFNHLG
jgi:hypothetical protein